MRRHVTELIEAGVLPADEALDRVVLDALRGDSDAERQFWRTAWDRRDLWQVWDGSPGLFTAVRQRRFGTAGEALLDITLSRLEGSPPGEPMATLHGLHLWIPVPILWHAVWPLRLSFQGPASEAGGDDALESQSRGAMGLAAMFLSLLGQISAGRPLAWGWIRDPRVWVCLPAVGIPRAAGADRPCLREWVDQLRLRPSWSCVTAEPDLDWWDPGPTSPIRIAEGGMPDPCPRHWAGDRHDVDPVARHALLRAMSGDDLRSLISLSLGVVSGRWRRIGPGVTTMQVDGSERATSLIRTPEGMAIGLDGCACGLGMLGVVPTSPPTEHGYGVGTVSGRALMRWGWERWMRPNLRGAVVPGSTERVWLLLPGTRLPIRWPEVSQVTDITAIEDQDLREDDPWILTSK